jgi:hypothetical protein
MPSSLNQFNPYPAVGRVGRLGVQICVGIPALFFFAALILRANLNFLAQPLQIDLTLIGYAVIGIAVADIAAAFILKRRVINAAVLRQRFDLHPSSFARQLAAAYVPIFAVAAAPSLYGLIFFLIGGDLETYVLVSVFCPAGLMLLKPRADEVEELADQLFGDH